MVRRDFLKLSGLLSAALLIQVQAVEKMVSPLSDPLEVESQGKLYRGTPDGKIFVSANAGRDWQMHTNFGAHVSVFSLTANQWEQVQAVLGVAQHRFKLALSTDHKGWKKV